MSTLPLVQPIPLAPLAEDLRGGRISITDMLEHMFAPRFNTVEPQVQSFVEADAVMERLYDAARELQERFSDAEQRPPLYGIPVGIKDIFHADGFVTRAGTNVPPQVFAGAEAVMVQKLKSAGALIAGKTITTEFAYFEPGPTRNPHDLERTPGGSSSGSAAAVAAGLVPLATGTQTVGSVIRPAAYCGVVGFKPTYDRIDSTGVIYFSQSVDHAGLFTADVAGMRLAAFVLLENWEDRLPTHRPTLGIPEGAYLQQASAQNEFAAQVQRLEDAGYAIRRVPMFSDIEALNALHSDLNAAELAQFHAEWFAEYGDHYRLRTADLIRKGQGISPQRVQEGRENRLLLRETLMNTMWDEGIDLWISPAAPDVAPLGITSTGNPMMNLPWTHAGLPTITVPAGKGQYGLPLGLQISGEFNDDERVLAWAEEIAAVFR